MMRTSDPESKTGRLADQSTDRTMTEGGISGAESLVRTLVAGGVDTCFANPGTSEMHFVSALDRVPGIRCVLAGLKR